MKRLTVEEVKEAYEKSGLKPVTGNWIDIRDDNIFCGCALSAVVCAKGEEKITDFMLFVHSQDDYAWQEIIDEVSEETGLDPKYVQGFVMGYDRNWYIKSHKDDLYHEGYRDGLKASIAIFPDWSKPPLNWKEDIHA